MAEWSSRLGHGHEGDRYIQMAQTVYESFNARYWNSERGYLFDLVDGDPEEGRRLRPNQIFSFSLHHPVLHPQHWSAVLNIVKEKEAGTIEQINVTPVKKYQFILGKLIPFWVLGMVVLSLGMLIARVVYGIIPAGSILTIYIFSAVYLLAILGLGLLVSTFTSSQQQAMLISFFMMMIFVLLGGLYTSIDSMPAWAKLITKVNPVTYFVDVMRMVVLKGSSLFDIRYHLMVMGGFAVVLNSWAVWTYRKRS